MFELMIAVLITSITLVGLIGLVSTSVTNNTISEDRTGASKYTAEASEWIRKQRDDNWTAFSSLASSTGNTYCLDYLPADVSSLTGGHCVTGSYIANTIYIREATFKIDTAVNGQPTVIEVIVVTSWNDSQGYHESRLSTYLSNWKSG